LEFHKPFFNSSDAYKDVIIVLVYSEHSLALQVKGSGIGWKAKYVDKVRQQKRLKQDITQKDNSSDDVWIGMA
jgi:hypothetical protein